MYILADKAPGTLAPDKRRLRVRHSIILIKLVIVVLAIALVRALFTLKSLRWLKIRGINPSAFCLTDSSHLLFSQAHLVLMQTPFIRGGLQFLSSMFVDAAFVFALSTWIIGSDTGRLLYSYILFYGVRGVIQENFTFKFPAGGYWDSPGIPSLMVPYGLASDFYYSGHTGYFILLLREQLYTDKDWKMMTLLFLCMVYMVLIILLYRVHYVIGSIG